MANSENAVNSAPTSLTADDKEPSDGNNKPVCCAGKSAGLWTIFLAIFVVSLSADLASKHHVFKMLSAMQPDPLTGKLSKTIIPGVFDFTLSTNPGVVFGFDKIPDVVVVLASLLAFVMISIFFAMSDARARFTHCSLAMILAGAAGNLYDRLFAYVEINAYADPIVITREVRDFIDFSPLHIGSLNFPWIFNVADVLLVVGVGILMIISIFSKHNSPQTQTADEPGNPEKS